MAQFYAGQRLTAGVLNRAFPIEVWKTAPQSVTSSTALVDDNELFFNAEANAKYRATLYLLYTGALDPAGGLKLQWTLPALGTMRWTNFGANIGAPAAYNVVTEAQAAGAPRSVPTNAGTQMSCQPIASIVIGATAGVARLRWAQNSSSATPTTIAEGSWLSVQRVA